MHLLNTNKSSVMLHVRSVDGVASEDGFNTDFSIYLKEHLTCLPGEHFLMSLSSAQIPYSFYNIQDGMNNLIIINGVDKLIPAGNYNVITLTAVVKEFGIILKYSVMTGKYTFTSPSLMDLILTDLSPLAQLGLPEGNYSLGTSELVSHHVINMYSFNSLYLRTTNLHSLNSLETRSGYSDILSKIEIQSSPNEFIYFVASQNTHKSLIKQREISMIQFKLTGTDNRLINLNGCDFEFSIQFDVIKENSDVAVDTGEGLNRIPVQNLKTKENTNVQRPTKTADNGKREQ